MDYALIIAGGSGTRLWPMSRAGTPKQLIPLFEGKSLLRLSVDRLAGLIPPSRLYICAGESHRAAILAAVPELPPENYLGEPQGRDTLNAVGLGAAVIHHRDPDAVIGIFTADHVIEPVPTFQHVVRQGLHLARHDPTALVTFGVTPTHAATGYGYLELGAPLSTSPSASAFKVNQFKEKPDAPTAQTYLNAGPTRYLWNSGMFVWHAQTLLHCIERFTPVNLAGLARLGQTWDTPARSSLLHEIYPTLPKISVDYAIMEPASKATDGSVHVVAVPLTASWLDVGSWPSFAAMRKPDDRRNTHAAAKTLTLDTTDTLLVPSDPDHLLATIGCENLIVIHTPQATLICHADRAEDIKTLHKLIGEKFGPTEL